MPKWLIQFIKWIANNLDNVMNILGWMRIKTPDSVNRICPDCRRDTLKLCKQIPNTHKTVYVDEITGQASYMLPTGGRDTIFTFKCKKCGNIYDEHTLKVAAGLES